MTGWRSLAACLVVALAVLPASRAARQAMAADAQTEAEAAIDDAADWILRLFRGRDDGPRAPRNGSTGSSGRGSGDRGTPGAGGGGDDDGGNGGGGDDGGGDDGGGDDGGGDD